MYDVIIIGAGPAGLTSAIYTSRRGLKTLILSKDLGGEAINIERIENYPGFKEIEGFKLIKAMEEQVKGFGVEFVYDEVVKITHKGKTFIVKTTEKEYESKTIILAFGKTPRNLNVPGEKEFTGKGISYCATCDAPLFRGKTVAVVGGGNASLDATILLSDIAKKIYLIHRRDEFRGFESFVNEVKKKKNVEFVLNSIVAEIKGNKTVKSVIIEDANTKKRKEIEVEGVFIEIGSEVKTDFIKDLVKLNNNQVMVNKNCETSCPGIFAAGDVTDTPFKQIVVSAGEGAKAGLTAYNYIHGIKSMMVLDWRKMNK
ncbi:MAG: thioredoxin-disulfide reductase [Candidatus Aenigmarchaeota archaeon]|nr:thioredoxin-disulfide reductase [Candidatus Aenigmarchaeota archaeon]